MLIGRRSLGLVVLVVLFAIGFLIRRKWRKAAARSEEIRRLLISASEESARAEIEATEGYYYTNSSVLSPDSVPRPVVQAPTPSVSVSVLKPPVFQCAVCFSPTTTRCAKCKAVRYCSGRCQILHWRQGHKDECRAYVAVKPVKDVSGSSFKQGDVKDSNDGLPDEKQPEVGSFFKSTSESSSEEYSTFSTPTGSSVETSSSSSVDFDWNDSHQFTDVKLERHTVASPTRKSNSSEKIKQTVVSPTKKFNSLEKINQTVVSPARKSYDSEKIIPNKSNQSDEDLNPRVSSSSSLTDGSNVYSFSGPSDFWSGTVPLKKSSIDELQPSGSNEKKGGTLTSTILDKSAPTGLGSKKSNDKISPSSELLTDGVKSTRPPKYVSEMLKPRDVVTNSTQSIFKETKYSSSGVGQHLPVKDSKASGDTPYAIPEKTNHMFNNKSIASPVFKSTSRLASQFAKPVTVHEEESKVATTSNSVLIENSASARNGLKTSMLKVVDQIMPSKLTRQCSPWAESEMAHKYSCKGLFSYKLFVKLYNWKQVELRPFGLKNCGNSCYANAVLQCLTYTPALSAYLYQGLHSKACDKRGWCFTCEFEGLVLTAKNGSSPLSPIRILSQIENIGSNLGPGREEDAHEFLRYAIDTLQSVCLKESGVNASNSIEEETTLIGLTFGGYLRSKIQCMKCGGKSERHERMMDLTVEIEGDIGTLEEALNKFTCTETLDGENKYKCGRCKSYERAKKKLTLLEAPNVLTIALKRFQSGKFGKLNKSIHFPEILDMAPYVSGTSDKSPVYGLYGVVVHVDIMNAAFSGHYVCYVKNFENRWFKIDDMIVKEVDVRSVLSKGAYMLLYSRCSPRAPRLIRSLLWPQHQHDPKKHRAPTLSTEPWRVKHDDHLAIRHRTPEEESSSSSEGSVIFSETCSCSTESSHSDFSCDWEYEYNSTSTPWRRNLHLNTSDSDTSSSSSSSFSSPLYSRSSLLRERSRSCKAGPGVLYHDHDDECRKLSCSNSCREANVDRLGGRPTYPLRRPE